MDAVILVAGIGSRLKDKTKNLPKCLVNVNDQPILKRQLDILNQCNIRTIYLVGGYQFEKLQKYVQSLPYQNLVLIENKDFLTTNNMYSLSLVSPFLKGKDFLWLNGDVLFHQEVIEGLLHLKEQNGIAIDPSIYLEESMKIKVTDNRIMGISKTILKEEAFATSIDVYKITKSTSVVLFDTIHHWLLKDKNSWSEMALNQIFNQEFFTYYSIHTPWIEIDNLEDLNKASQLFQ